jgi:hypothetical protein
MTDMTSPMPTTQEVVELSKKMKPLFQLLAHQHPAVQGGVLADMVATWLAGHFVENSVAETRRLRAEMFTDLIVNIERLVPICAEEIGTPHDPVNAEDALYERQ